MSSEFQPVPETTEEYAIYSDFSPLQGSGLPTTSEGFRIKAACNSVANHGNVTHLFFAPLATKESTLEKQNREAAAKQICARCVVRQACLEYSLAEREQIGIWGGKTERERREILNNHRFRGYNNAITRSNE